VRSCECGFRYDEVGVETIPERLLHTVHELCEEAPSRVLAQLGAATEMASWTFVDVRRILRPPAD
jgi:hypothetical protein